MLEKLDQKLKNVIYLVYLYGMLSVFVNSFLGVILYKERGSVEELILFYLFSVSFGMISILMSIYFLPKFKVNIRKIFRIGFSLIAFSYLYFTYSVFVGIDSFNYNLFAAINASGASIYWHALSAFELKATSGEQRVLYLSLTQIGKQVFSVLLPLLVSIFILIGSYFFGNDYLAIVLFMLFLVSLLLYRTEFVDGYIPRKVRFLTFSWNKKDLYLLNYVNGMSTIAFMFLFIYLTSVVFENVYEVGFYQFFLNAFSIFLIMRLMKVENKRKFLNIYFVLTLIGVIPLVFSIDFIYYVFFTIMFSVAYPLFAIFSRGVVIRSAEKISLNKTNSLFIKEIFIGAGRVSSLLVLLFLSSFESFLLFLIIFVFIMFILEYLFIRYLEM